MSNESEIDTAVAEGGAYEVIRSRLTEQADSLDKQVEVLNQSRISEFGQPQMEITSRVRVRTENNCIARDIVPVGNLLLFGYNVFIGLKKETQVNDVFSLFQLKSEEGAIGLVEQDLSKSFLSDAKFQKDFKELYVYYKEARLLQLKIQNDLLFAVFQIGKKLTDVRVFQWMITKEEEPKYIDNRGERSLQIIPSHDFEWQSVTREQHVNGTHAHVNIGDKVFVETIKGSLTVKIENNTEDGLGIYSEPVDDKNQSLSDADIQFAEVGSLVLLKILPYREQEYRFLVYNTRTQKVNRIDAIGSACISLPEDHGIIFPGGYYLQSGETKSFPDDIPGLQFKRQIRSPNGEDVLYVFYEPETGLCGLYCYNMIHKALKNPIYAHGYSIFNDGTAIFFSSEEEPTRIHPMQVWQTPFYSDEFAAKQPTTDSFFSRIGNRELVRGISDISSICRLIENPRPTRLLYEDLIKSCKDLFDSYYWLEENEVEDIHKTISEITATSELVIDEFEKVSQIRLKADALLKTAKDKQKHIVTAINPKSWKTPEQYVQALVALRHQRGHLISLQEQRYIDKKVLKSLESELQEHFDKLSTTTVAFLANDDSLAPYRTKIEELQKAINKIEVVVEIAPLVEELDSLSHGLDVVTEILNGLEVEDATVRTKIIDDISTIYGQLNQIKALARNRRKQLGSGEASAEFAAQFRLFSQSINNALAQVDTPDKADQELSRLMIQLEELESKFSEYDQFLDEILAKREELHSAFEERRQTLLEERQRRSQNLFTAAERTLKGVNRRASTFKSEDDLNSYFASDPMIMKLTELSANLREYDDQVKADDVEAQLKAAKETAIRALRDKQDIYEDGGNVIKLGAHKFSVNSQVLDLTLIPKNDGLYRHLIGTDFYEKLQNKALLELQPYWQQALVSENNEVSRCEYLASLIIKDAEQQANDLSLSKLYKAIDSQQELSDLVDSYISDRYQEGYEKGIHDNDTCHLLSALIPIHKRAGLLRFSPKSRALAMLFWSFSSTSDKQRTIWQSQALSAKSLLAILDSNQGFNSLTEELSTRINRFKETFGLPFSTSDITSAVAYLGQELASGKLSFVFSDSAAKIEKAFGQKLKLDNEWQNFQKTISVCTSLDSTEQSQDIRATSLRDVWHLTFVWLDAFVQSNIEQLSNRRHYIPEVAAFLICQHTIERRNSDVDLLVEVPNLLSEHRNIEDGKLTIALDEFNERMQYFHDIHLPNFNRYHQLRRDIMETSRRELQLSQFVAKPLSSFVRNKLINEVYFPLIGANLAKQMGTVGEDKRTDLMGLLLLISPPGYGKTTLMEYIANRLGLIFMKINCPSLGHEVTSIDPSTAPNATARQELEKLNLGLEMGNNVMLYLDDIQHTHPEFLQKFISLCDGTRRIDGVWEGQSKTYDMRGKKFCVVMAGNPYTESGDVFKVPDMLANRADIYNLGDVLNGKESQFAMSYIENALTSNAVLAPLALRDMQDVYKFIDMANGKDVASTDLKYEYSGAEINEICTVLKHLFVIQDVILKVNLEYIKSAATAEDYRQEPAFKLQGSYRNMNKMAEKVSAVMNHNELMQLIEDHYIGEAQTLTSGAEENLLKLAIMRGTMNEQQQSRWAHICQAFESKHSLQIEGDPTHQAVKQLSQMAHTLTEIRDDMYQSDTGDLIKPINRVAAAMYLLSKVWRGDEKSNYKEQLSQLDDKIKSETTDDS
ncbi:MAG: DNA repair ATPase [Aestuariibacter sp.]